MKKFLSIILACAMIMSLFCVVPASATVTEGAYWIDDFETGAASFLSNMSIENNAANVYGGSYAAKKTMTFTAGSTSHNYDSLHDIHLSDAFVDAILPGDQIRVTFKYKLTYPLAENSTFALVTNSINASGTASYPAQNCSVTAPSDTTNWQTFDATLGYPANAAARNDGTYATLFYIRISSGSNGPLTVATAPTEDTQVGIYFDDVEVRKVVDQGDPKTHVFNGTQDLKKGTGTYPTTFLKNVADPFGATGNVVYQTGYNGTNGNAHNMGYFFADFNNATLAEGDTVGISFKLAVENNAKTGYSNYSNIRLGSTDPSGDSTTAIKTWSSTEFKFNMDQRGWQNFNFSYTHTGADTTVACVRFTIAHAVTNGLKDTIVYLDDIEITITHANALSKTPVVTSLVATVNNEGVVTPTYTFAKGAGDAVDSTEASVYKIKNANGGIVTSGFVGDGITVPSGVTATTLEIIPVTSTGYIGAPVTSPIEKELTISTEFSGADFSTDTFTVSYSLKNILRTNEDIYALSIIVSYNSLGEIIDYDEKYIYCPNTFATPSTPAVTGTHTFVSGSGSLAGLGLAGTDEVAYVKAFLWKATGNTASTWNDVTMAELAPVNKAEQ